MSYMLNNNTHTNLTSLSTRIRNFIVLHVDNIIFLAGSLFPPIQMLVHEVTHVFCSNSNGSPEIVDILLYPRERGRCYLEDHPTL